MTNYCSHESLPVIDFDFHKNKNEEIEFLINNLKLKDVETDEIFNTTLNKIKRKILFKPVVFDKPKIIDHTQIEKEYPPSYNNMWGGKRKVFVITIEIKFTGDCELFKYKPNSYSYSSSDIPIIYQPTGNSIILEIESFNIDDKNKILDEAQQHMNLTYNFIRYNNTFVEKWNSSIEPTIENRLSVQKKKLENLYGN